jgi:hypothetical protein
MAHSEDYLITVLRSAAPACPSAGRAPMSSTCGMGTNSALLRMGGA